MLLTKGIYVEIGCLFLKLGIFFLKLGKWFLSGIGNGAQYRPGETRWKSHGGVCCQYLCENTVFWFLLFQYAFFFATLQLSLFKTDWMLFLNMTIINPNKDIMQLNYTYFWYQQVFSTLENVSPIKKLSDLSM